jgi:hypothetical protein
MANNVNPTRGRPRRWYQRRFPLPRRMRLGPDVEITPAVYCDRCRKWNGTLHPWSRVWPYRKSAPLRYQRDHPERSPWQRRVRRYQCLVATTRCSIVRPCLTRFVSSFVFDLLRSPTAPASNGSSPTCVESFQTRLKLRCDPTTYCTSGRTARQSSGGREGDDGRLLAASSPGKWMSLTTQLITSLRLGLP